MKVTSPLIVYMPDSRGVEISPYGRGNTKIGPDVFTYSRPAGRLGGTCPGATTYCEDVCYAKRIGGVVGENYQRNRASWVPPIPPHCKLLRIHISGDFDTRAYIDNWVTQLVDRPDVRAWAYTRSWRVPELLPALERLRAVPNMQLFASMERMTEKQSALPPRGWRMAWIAPKGLQVLPNHSLWLGPDRTTGSYLCPEQDGKVGTCQECNYCIEGQKHDVTFQEH